MCFLNYTQIEELLLALHIYTHKENLGPPGVSNYKTLQIVPGELDARVLKLQRCEHLLYLEQNKMPL